MTFLIVKRYVFLICEFPSIEWLKFFDLGLILKVLSRRLTWNNYFKHHTLYVVTVKLEKHASNENCKPNWLIYPPNMDFNAFWKLNHARYKDLLWRTTSWGCLVAIQYIFMLFTSFKKEFWIFSGRETKVLMASETLS